MAKKMFVYLLFLSMIITIVSFPVNAEETDMPSLSTEKLTEDTTSSTSNSTNLLENMKQIYLMRRILQIIFLEFQQMTF